MVAAGVGLWICARFDFDVLQSVFRAAAPTTAGIFVTGLAAAGGSAGAMGIFQGLLGLNKESRDAQVATRKAAAEAAKAQAEAAKAEAEARKAAAGG